MPIFEELVRLAGQHSRLQALQPVVEKELLHHEILRTMAEAGLLHQLTFIGGTCLRACHGSNRLSEDLDFTGGSSFRAEDLRQLGQTVRDGVRETYGLDVVVTEPKRAPATEAGNVCSWKLQVLTHPGSKHLPQQRIHLDICAVNSYERHPAVLRNHYGIELGTSGLVVQAESMHEILADKMLALALRPRIQHRDLWDIAWLTQQGESCEAALVWRKCDERGIEASVFRSALAARIAGLSRLEQPFRAEMERFLPRQTAATSIEAPGFWTYLSGAVTRCAEVLTGQTGDSSPSFPM